VGVSLEDLSGERVWGSGDWGNAQAGDAHGVLGEGESDANSIEFRPVSVGPGVGREDGGFRKPEGLLVPGRGQVLRAGG
jgi:hypothetical protein